MAAATLAIAWVMAGLVLVVMVIPILKLVHGFTQIYTDKKPQIRVNPENPCTKIFIVCGAVGMLPDVKINRDYADFTD
jgi:hypothetical protein